MAEDSLLITVSQRRSTRRLLIVVSFLVIIGTLAHLYSQETVATLSGEAQKTQLSKSLVVSSQTKDDSFWLTENFPDWELVRYVVDDPTAQYTIPVNKGHEAMVYLTYIVENYNRLPDLMVFMHGERYQWHNDDPIYDGVPVLNNLQLPYVMSQGYTNLRCVWTLGCPSGFKGLDQPIQEATDEAIVNYVKAFKEMFLETSLPSSVGVACCAQFAVTRERIHQRPLKDYQHYKQWLLDTPLTDYDSGRIFEYLWHIMFGQPAFHCPNAEECYCKTFGLCNLECKENQCGERWPFPPYSSLPKKWPTVGWNDETRSQEFLTSQRNNAGLNRTLL